MKLAILVAVSAMANAQELVELLQAKIDAGATKIGEAKFVVCCTAAATA